MVTVASKATHMTTTAVMTGLADRFGLTAERANRSGDVGAESGKFGGESTQVVGQTSDGLAACEGVGRKGWV